MLACADLRDITVLQRGLATHFGIPDINVNLRNGTHLTVLFPNSPVAELPDSQQISLARQVANYVRDHYPRYERLESIEVGFVGVRGGGAERLITSRDSYRFTPADLGPRVTNPR